MTESGYHSVTFSGNGDGFARGKLDEGALSLTTSRGGVSVEVPLSAAQAEALSRWLAAAVALMRADEQERPS